MAKMYDLIIIGAGPAGASAAIYAGQLKMRTLLIGSDEIHEPTILSAHVQNYPGIANLSAETFMRTAHQQAEHFGVDLMNTEVQSVDFTGELKSMTTSNGDFRAISVLIATGIEPRANGFHGEKEFAGRGVSYNPISEGISYSDRDIFVVGGGYNAAEECIFLTRYAKKVHAIIRGSSFTCAPSVADRVLNDEKISVYFNTELEAVTGKNTVERAIFKNNITGETWEINSPEPQQAFGLFVICGHNPRSLLFEGQIALDAGGYIPTDSNMMTNNPGVFAAGSIRTKAVRQLVTAVADGAASAYAAERYVFHKKESLDLRINEMSEKGAEAGVFFDHDLIANLKPMLQRFQNPVTIRVILTGNDELSNEIRTFISDFTALSDNIHAEFLIVGENPIKERELNTNLFPAIGILDKDLRYHGVLFHGVPSGHEFNAFVLALYNTAGPGQEIPPHMIQEIMSLPPHNVKVAVSLSCTVCPDAVQAAQLIALYNPGIQSEMIDLAQFSALREKYKLLTVPAILIDDKEIYFGRKGLKEMIALLKQ